MNVAPRSRRLAISALAALALALGGCSSGSDDGPKPDVPKGFDVPDGVTLTPAGTTVAVGKPVSVVYEIGGNATSAITVTVTKVRKGSIKKDFTFFSLDAASKASTPYYVDVSVRNEGPAGLGGVSIPVLAHTASNTVYPPNELVGTFKPCPTSALPKSFLKGTGARLCMVYLLPKGERLRTIDLQTGSEADAVHWRP